MLGDCWEKLIRSTEAQFRLDLFLVMEFEFNLRLRFGIGLLVLPIAQSGHGGFHEHWVEPGG
jgi:hypothetical protein